MLPKIDGIVLYPLRYKITSGGTLPTKTDINSVRCAVKCDVPFDRTIDYHLVCAGNAKGDYNQVDVAGEIIKKTGVLAPPEPLERMSLDGQSIGKDGSYRIFWSWPDKAAFREINGTYEVQLRLIKSNDVFDGRPEGERPQTPFTITLLPPAEPVQVVPASHD